MSLTPAQRILLAGAGGDGWLPVEAGESSARVLARADGGAFAKLVPASGVPELREERERTRWAVEAGLPAAPVLDWAEHLTGACMITGAMPGIPADTLDDDLAVRAWPGIVRAARSLHDLPVQDCPFDRGVERMIGLADAVVSEGAARRELLRPEQLGHDLRDLLADLRREVPRRRAQEAADLAVCHGDLCLPNILVDPDSLEVTGFLDLGRLGRADPHADLALLLANAQDTWPGLADRLQASLELHYGRTVDAERLRFHLHLDPLTWG